MTRASHKRRRFTPQAEVELEVPFHDVDMLQLVWHGHYYKYFEIARTELLRARGLSAEQLRDSGYLLVVVESGCRYPSPLRFGDRFRVGAAFGSVDYGMTIDYQIWNLSAQRRAAYGHTVLAALDSSGALQLHTPEVLLARIR